MFLNLLPTKLDTIFIAPLNWGLGHATRSSEIISKIKQHYPDSKIILGSDGAAKRWLEIKYPEQEIVELPGYNIRYTGGKNFITNLFFQLPRLMVSIFKEHFFLQKLVKRRGIDLVISDNRYGMWSKRAYSVFITHQIELLPSSFVSMLPVKIATKAMRFAISKFDQCWIPDFPDAPGLAGKMSHPRKLPANAAYIGPLSRFKEFLQSVNDKKEYLFNIMFIVSGPEPQRSIFFDLIVEQLQNREGSFVIVSGKPDEKLSVMSSGNLKIYSHLKDPDMIKSIMLSKLIVARSGYSTIMDLYVTGGKAAFVPTPGQTEQEYLAKQFEEYGIAFMQSQKCFNIDEILKNAGNYKGFTKSNSN